MVFGLFCGGIAEGLVARSHICGRDVRSQQGGQTVFTWAQLPSQFGDEDCVKLICRGIRKT